MRELILLLFVPLTSFGQEITIVSFEDEPVIFSQETIEYTNSYGLSVNIDDSQKIYVDFNNDGKKDIISRVAGNPYTPSFLSIFLWDTFEEKYIENHQYLIITEGESMLFNNTVADFNSDGLNDIYVAIENYHGEPGQEPDYYPENSYYMPGHLFLNNGQGFDSQFIDESTYEDGRYPKFSDGYVLDIDGDGSVEIINSSINDHPENTPFNNFLVTSYEINSNNDISYSFLMPWEDAFEVQNINPDDTFYVRAGVLRDYNNRTYIQYTGFQEDLANGFKRKYPEVCVYEKEFDSNGQLILVDKYRLERNEEIQNYDNFVERDSFYIDDLDNDGSEEIIIQMTNDYELGAGLAVFDNEGSEITDLWFEEGDNQGNSANGFHFVDLNNDGKKDIIMVSNYNDNYNETVLYLNNGETFEKKVLDTDYKWNFPIDSNEDGNYEIMTSTGSNSKLYFLDYSSALNDNGFSPFNLSIYPNPSSDIVYINGVDKELDAKVTDLTGKQVIREYAIDKLDISCLEKGIYIINLTDGVNSSFHKIIKN